MDMDEVLINPEEIEISSQLTDGSEIQDSETAAYTLAVTDYNMIAVKSIPIGALCGAIIMIIGFTYLGIVHIFKKF